MPRYYEYMEQKHYVGVTDQKNIRIAVFDLDVPDWSDPKALVWEHKSPATFHAAGLKLRRHPRLGGDVALFCGLQGAGIVTVDGKNEVYVTGREDLPINPHSVELLPDGTFLVCGTQGHEIRAYDPFSSSPHPTAIYPVPGYAHGILWDEREQLLWVQCDEVLALSVTGGPAAPVFAEKRHFSGFPAGMHDLAPLCSDPDHLWVTCVEGVLLMDKNDGSCTRNYPAAAAIGTPRYTPGICMFPDGVTAWVTPNKVFREWDADYVNVYYPDRDVPEIRRAPDSAWYKCRAWLPDYL